MTTRVVCDCGWTRSYPTRAQAEYNAGRHVCPNWERFEKPHVRRATRRHRCKRCGLEAVYDNAGAAEARYWFNRHSCRKHEEAMLRHAYGEARLAAIDRTPKPCLHKEAAHTHGTYACYVLDGCRCHPCARARSTAETQRARLKAYGRYHKYVDAYPVRLHLAELRDYGIGLKQVEKLAGVPQGVLWKLWYGKKKPDGTSHVSCRVLRRTAEKIYAVEPIPANLGVGVVDHERTPLARRHLRALVALGWSISELGRRLDITSPGNARSLIATDRPITRGTIDCAEALFTQLCMTPPPQDTHHQRATVARARNYARAHGWPPPLDLDDLDGPNTQEVA